jgi:hypothetical protein
MTTRTILRSSATLVVLSAVAHWTAGPAAAECMFIPPFPRAEPAIRSAEEVIVGELVRASAGDLVLGPNQGPRTMALRVTEVLRGPKTVGQLVDVEYLQPNWPWVKISGRHRSSRPVLHLPGHGGERRRHDRLGPWRGPAPTAHRGRRRVVDPASNEVQRYEQDPTSRAACRDPKDRWTARNRHGSGNRGPKRGPSRSHLAHHGWSRGGRGRNSVVANRASRAVAERFATCS